LHTSITAINQRDTNMRKIIQYAVTLILLTEILTIALTPNQEATAITKGVFPGNTFTYGRNDGKPWILMDQSYAPIFSTWEKYVNMSMVTFEITPNPTQNAEIISYNRTIEYQNQSTTELPASLNINTGAGDITFFISTGLKSGDLLYPNPANENFTWTINETRIDPNWGGREICFFNLTTVSSLQQGTTYASNLIYWDRLTGALLQVHEGRASVATVNGQPLAVGGTVDYWLIANNIGIPVRQSSGGGDIMPIIVAVIVIFVIAIIAIVVRMSTNAPKKKWKRLKK
jgi:hypothetical protein